MMHIYAEILIGFAAVIAAVLFGVQWYTRRTYRPSCADVRAIVQATLEQAIEVPQFEEFCATRIARRPELEAVRYQYCQIVANPECVEPSAGRRCPVYLTDHGKQQLAALLKTLDGVAA